MNIPQPVKNVAMVGMLLLHAVFIAVFSFVLSFAPVLIVESGETDPTSLFGMSFGVLLSMLILLAGINSSWGAVGEIAGREVGWLTKLYFIFIGGLFAAVNAQHGNIDWALNIIMLVMFVVLGVLLPLLERGVAELWVLLAIYGPVPEKRKNIRIIPAGYRPELDIVPDEHRDIVYMTEVEYKSQQAKR